MAALSSRCGHYNFAAVVTFLFLVVLLSFFLAYSHRSEIGCDGAHGEVLRPVFLASRVQYISESDLHSKFALRPHHVWKYGRHPISDR